MSSPLQKSPLGVLGAFALKVLGRNPDKFGDTVLPTADVYDQYLLQTELQMQIVSAGITVAAFSNASVLLVPPGKIWRVLSVGTQGATITGADLALVWAVIISAINPAGTQAVVTTGVLVGSAPIGAVRGHGLYLPRPLVLPGGWGLRFQFSTSAAVANANSIQNVALYQEIDA